ncbi:MAG: hypothetical protein WC624_00865 [Candidatus Margulisiibacteriota bacterium]
MKDRRFGPVVRQISNLSKEITFTSLKAASEIEKDPSVVACSIIAENRLQAKEVYSGKDSPPLVRLNPTYGFVYALKEEVATSIPLTVYQAPNIPHPRAAVLCISELMRQHSLQDRREGNNNGTNYSYSDRPEDCFPYQRIYGMTNSGRVYTSLAELQEKLPDIFQGSFADLGGGFGWPSFLWAQFAGLQHRVAMFESRTDLINRSKYSLRRLQSFGLLTQQVSIYHADFLTVDLTPYNTLHAYRPFLVQAGDALELAGSCYRVIFERLDQIRWPGRYFIGVISNGLNEIAKDFGYQLVLKTFGREVYRKD